MSSVVITDGDRTLTWSAVDLSRVDTDGEGRTLQAITFPDRDTWAADILDRGGAPPTVDDVIASIEARIAELQAQLEELRA